MSSRGESSSTPGKNIRIAGTDIGERIVQWRRRLGLTGAELAERAGLSERTIRAIERGHRESIQEKTLLLLAEALETTLDELLGQGTPGQIECPAPPGHRRRRGFLLLVPLAFLLLVAIAAAVWILDREGVKWTTHDDEVIARGGITGRILWHRIEPHTISAGRLAPWSRRQLLVGLSGSSRDEGQLRCLDLRSGRLLWSSRHDITAVASAFGDRFVTDDAFVCASIVPLDTDGDGEYEIAVRFTHARYYPCCICLFDRQGRLLAQYVHWGRLQDIRPVDLDEDGRDELLCWGTNNAPVFQGGTILLLDREHWHGVSLDQVCRPGCTTRDPARFRVVFPNFGPGFVPYVGVRIDVEQVFTTCSGDGSPNIDAMVGVKPFLLPVVLDRELRPLSVDINDGFLAMRSVLPDSLRGEHSPYDPRWRERWLARHYRFVEGRLVHPPAGTGAVSVPAAASAQR